MPSRGFFGDIARGWRENIGLQRFVFFVAGVVAGIILTQIGQALAR